MKRLLISVAVVLVAVVAIVVLAFRLSPWPSAWIIASMFSEGDQASEAALEKHVPAGVTARRDISYGGDPDEIFDIYAPEGTDRPLPTVVWVHGGGFIGGSKDGIANYMKVLAGHGYTTVAIEYSKGFGSAYPEPVEQVNAALGYLTGNAADLNIDPGAIVLAGDSAGANMAGQVALIVTNPDYADRIGISPTMRPDQLAAVLLLSGTFDLEGVNLSGDYAWFLNTVLWAYSGTRDFLEDERFRLISVTDHVTGSFPPSFVSSGNGDPLEPQAVALAQKLDGLGVPVERLFFPADREPPLPHEYQFNLDDPAGRETLARMLAFLDRVRGRSIAQPPAN